MKTWIAAIVVGLLICFALTFVIDVCMVGMQAEMQIQTVNYVERLITHHVESTGQWPRNWNDLQNDSLPGGAFSLPRDEARLDLVVAIKFDVALEEVGRMAPEAFAAVQPRTKPFYNYSDQYRVIIDAAKKSLATQPRPMPDP